MPMRVARPAQVDRHLSELEKRGKVRRWIKSGLFCELIRCPGHASLSCLLCLNYAGSCGNNPRCILSICASRGWVRDNRVYNLLRCYAESGFCDFWCERWCSRDGIRQCVLDNLREQVR